MASQKTIHAIGWSATSMCVIMYFTYVDQIRLNLEGKKGSALLPFATILNCMLWLMYGFFREKKDWPIIVANIPGVVLGAIAFFTAL